LKTLSEIQRQLSAGEFEFSRHAFRRAIERNISEQEIRDAGAKSEIIENYPQDKYSPSALLLGFTARWTTAAFSSIVCGVRIWRKLSQFMNLTRKNGLIIENGGNHA
jgi:hypothetical protein